MLCDFQTNSRRLPCASNFEGSVVEAIHAEEFESGSLLCMLTIQNDLWECQVDRRRANRDIQAGMSGLRRADCKLFASLTFDEPSPL